MGNLFEILTNIWRVSKTKSENNGLGFRPGAGKELDIF